MVPLFEGAFDYRGFLAELAADRHIEASLEWFGDDVQRTLSHDQRALQQLALKQVMPRGSSNDAREVPPRRVSRPGQVP
jgi:hypothetical protein